MKYNIKRINENSIREFNAQTGRQEDALENEGAERHILFVYGSLMKGEYNHDAYMKNALFLGNASIDHFSLYDLGSYPGIRHSRRREKVLGELYEVDQDAYEAICRLEGNGFLYQSEPVTAEIMDGRGHMEAETFVYLDDVAKKAEVYLQPKEVSLAIGRGGLNIKLASMLTGYLIDVYRESEEDNVLDDIYLEEFDDEIDQWIIDTLKGVGMKTARDVLGTPREELIAKTDLEEETIDRVLRILNEEFEKE